jgi:hypothetical protein
MSRPFDYRADAQELLPRPFCVTAAMAIEAPVLCANPTVFFQTPLELLPCSMKPHIKIVPANSEARGHRIGRFLIQIYALDQASVLRRHRRQQSLHARANNAFFFFIRRGIQLALESCEGSIPRITATVKIDDGPPQNPVEPRLGIFLIANLIGRLQRLEQALLNRVGGKVGIAEALARKACEFINVLQ